MEKLVIDNGLKSYEIEDANGNVRGIISFNPSDFGFIDRVPVAIKNIEAFKDQIPEDAGADILRQYDELIRKELNTLFGSDICTVIFGDVNCLSMSGGAPLYFKAIETLIPIVVETITKEAEASKERINKYTEGVV